MAARDDVPQSKATGDSAYRRFADHMDSQGGRPYAAAQTPTRQQAFELVRGILIDEIRAEPEQVTETATLEEDLDLDGVDILEAVMVLEQQLGVEVTAEETDKLQTVGDMVDLALAKMASNPQGEQA